MTDEALTDPTADPAADEALAADELMPADFDLASWLAGVQPERTSVAIYGRPDLMARIEELTQLPEVRKFAGDGELERLRAELHASRVVFTIEGRTPTHLEERSAQLVAQGLERGLELNLALLAEQIISPRITPEQLRKLWEVRDKDVDALVTAAHRLNNNRPEIGPRFLPAASD